MVVKIKTKMSYKIQKTYRKPEHNYSLNGAYFITICTQDRKNYFGKIENHQMQLSTMGKIAVQYWLEIPQHFKNVRLDNWVIMPNHLHGIVILEDKNQMTLENIVGTRHCRVRTGQCPVPTVQMNKFGPLKPNSISTIIGSYKSKVSKIVHQKYPNSNFSWQSRFHDRIIRNPEEFYNISQYIFYNPLNWHKDELFYK